MGGGTPTPDPVNWGGDIPFVTPPDLRPVVGGVVGPTERTLTEVGAANGSAVVPAGSVILSIRAPIGYVARTSAPVAFNQGCRALVPYEGNDARFLCYALIAAGPELESLGRGTTFVELSATQMAAFEIPVWAIDQQRAISNYLYRETAQIDTLIAEQERLIALLRERRTAIASQALGESHIVATGRRLKHYVQDVTQGWSPQAYPWPADGVASWGVLKAGAVNGGTFRPEENKELPDSEEPRPELAVKRGLLIISRANTRELLGSAAVVHNDYPRLMLCDKLYALTIDSDRADPDLIAAVLGTPRWRGLIEVQASGSSPSMQNISRDDILNLPMDLPERDKQDRLALEIATATAKIDELITETERFIELSRERRTALITAAVTGQIDVREGAA